MQQLQNVSEWDQEENCDVSYTAIKMSPSVLLTGCTKSYGGLNYNEVITICFDHSPYWPRLTDQGRQLLLLLISNSRMEKHFCKCQSGIIESLKTVCGCLHLCSTSANIAFSNTYHFGCTSMYVDSLCLQSAYTVCRKSKHDFFCAFFFCAHVSVFV